MRAEDSKLPLSKSIPVEIGLPVVGHLIMTRGIADSFAYEGVVRQFEIVTGIDIPIEFGL